MKILIIGDSHGHIVNLKAVMGISKKMQIKAVIHCGDWNNIKSVKTVLMFGIPLYTVMGNADIEDNLEEYLKFNTKKFNPSFLKCAIGGRKIGIKHRVTKDDKFEGLDIVFSGHYHSSESKMINFLKFVRPGALINGINFVVYETETNDVKFVKDE